MIATLSFSQEDYPKLIIIDDDTLVVFEAAQVKKINIIILKLDEAIEIIATFESENRDLRMKDSISTVEKNNLIEQNNISERIDLEKDNQIAILTEENKKKDKRIKILKKSRYLFLLGGILLGSATNLM